MKKKELENLVISCLFGNNSHNNNNNHMKQSVKIMSKLNDWLIEVIILAQWSIYTQYLKHIYMYDR